MSHYAWRTSRGIRKGRLHFYGHSHGDVAYYRSREVEVDCADTGFAPRTFNQLTQQMKTIGDSGEQNLRLPGIGSLQAADADVAADISNYNTNSADDSRLPNGGSKTVSSLRSAVATQCYAQRQMVAHRWGACVRNFNVQDPWARYRIQKVETFYEKKGVILWPAKREA